MAGRDRYESLRESERRALDQKKTQPAKATPPSPGWTHDQSMEAQQKSANKYNKWANAVLKQRHEEEKKAEQELKAQRLSETSQSSSSQKQKPVRTYEDLKAAYAEAIKSEEVKENKEQDKEKAKPAEDGKPKLKFFEDINKVEHDRER